MPKQQKILIAVISLVLVVVIVVTFFMLNKSTATGPQFQGKITKVIDRPNLAEDGYYGFEVQNSAGQIYVVDATGNLNNASIRDDQTCVDVPKVKLGDSVSFKLPSSRDFKKTFIICHPKDIKGYYFKVN